MNLVEALIVGAAVLGAFGFLVWRLLRPNTDSGCSGCDVLKR